MNGALEAGSGTTQIPVRLPFFVEVTSNNVYLKGDKPVIILRAYGADLVKEEKIQYRMKLVDSTGEEINAAGEGEAYQPFDWELPVLETGKYTLTIEGQSGNYQDLLKKDFIVKESLLERSVSNQQILKDGDILRGIGKEPVTLVFSDYEKSQYLQGLYGLSFLNGARLEEQLAKREAQNLLRSYFPQENTIREENVSKDYMNYQQADGGIGFLPYGGSDLALSVYAASCYADEFDKKALAGYLYHILENNTQDASMALWGLAALKEPVLININEKLLETDLSPSERINLAFASLDIGNGALGENVFQELMTKFGEDLGNSMRIKVGKNQDEILAATGQMALLAARYNLPEKNKLYQYLLDNKGKELLNTLEQLEILSYNLRYLNNEAVSFTYEYRGEKVNKTLQGQETFALNLLPEELETVSISEVKGKVGILTTYVDKYTEKAIVIPEELHLSRTYTVAGQESKLLNRNELVLVTISYDIEDKGPAGNYEIVDILPAGLAYVNRPYSYQSDRKHLTYPTVVKGQKLVFAVSKGKGIVQYFARVISPGEYQAQSPLLGHSRSPQVCVLGNKEIIIIK